MIVYLSIGNSDDKLTQHQWHDFCNDVETVLLVAAREMHGNWSSAPRDPWQNACWCFEPWPHLIEEAQQSFRKMAARYGQDSIAWAEVRTTKFLAPDEDGGNGRAAR